MTWKRKENGEQNKTLQYSGPQYFKNKQQPFELSFFPSPRYNNSFGFTSKDNFCTPRHPLPSGQPMSHSCPQKSWEIFCLRLGTWDQNNCPWKVPKKKSRLCGCWPSESFKSWWPWKNLANSPLFHCKILFFVHQQNIPPQVTTTSLVKGQQKCSSSKRNSASPPLQIVGAWAPFGSSCGFTCWLYTWRMGCASIFFLWSWNLKGNSAPSGRFWHKLQMQKQNWFTRAQKNKQNNPPSH